MRPLRPALLKEIERLRSGYQTILDTHDKCPQPQWIVELAREYLMTTSLREKLRADLLADRPLAAIIGHHRVFSPLQEPPESAFPYVSIGDVTEHEITIDGWSREGHREAHMIAGAIMQALADSGLVLALADVRRETDGRTFRALVRYSVVFR